jgi:hypothetical protein
MRLMILTLAMILVHRILLAQDVQNSQHLNKNHLSVELGGAGVLGSINYERLVKAKSNKLLLRVGLSYLPLTVNNKKALGTPILPFGLYYLIGDKHHLELGLNNTFGYTVDNITNKNELKYFLMPSVGYRFENFFKKSVYFSIAYSPVFAFEDYSKCVNCIKADSNTGQFQNWAKIAVGYNF